jgi:hypothetical protein
MRLECLKLIILIVKGPWLKDVVVNVLLHCEYLSRACRGAIYLSITFQQHQQSAVHNLDEQFRNHSTNHNPISLNTTH